ncbi:hypothetical protein IE53DRAFT_387998 [Violaceomyces palustris]|uniref:Uncharacterized protein n=1 Tax=Violaceomyces palustris TaxID=1673888 RepID=A0ACD0NVJ0_9BASI|nr:hypothetical protein IE53DRAFT_387998 [Violaceomyces palustris]
MHPAVAILLTVLITQSVSWIGKDNIINLTHKIFLQLRHRRTLSQQRALRKEIYENKQQLAKTSSQDEFSKWAKLRRKIDKSLQELERINGVLSSSRSTFGIILKAFLFLFTTAFPFIVTSYYGKTPIFYLPPGGWFGPLGWILSLPRAPAGSVSSSAWSTICVRVILIIIESFKNLIPTKVQPESTYEQPSTQNGAGRESSSPAPTKSAAGEGIGKEATGAFGSGSDPKKEGGTARRRATQTPQAQEL